MGRINISVLEQADISYLTNLDNENNLFLDIFKLFPNQFSMVCPNLDIENVQTKDMECIVKKNINDQFINSVLDQWISQWVDDIQKNLSNSIDLGFDINESIVDALNRSLFYKRPGLYFKLTGKQKSNSDIKMLETNMKIAQKNKPKFDVIITSKIFSFEKSLIFTLVGDMHQNEAKLQQLVDSYSGTDADLLSQFDERSSKFLPKEDDHLYYKYMSLGRMIDEKTFLRIADLSTSGEFEMFKRDPKLSPYFKNRERIRFEERYPAEYFVLNWETEENIFDQSRDYPKNCNLNRNISPLEVIQVEGVLGVESLIDTLKNGIRYRLRAERALFIYPTRTKLYRGIYLNKNNYNYEADKITIADDCEILPVYVISEEDVLIDSNKFSFLKSACCGIPERVAFVKRRSEIVRDILVSSMSKQWLREKGIIRKTIPQFKRVISEAPLESTVQKIVSKLHCSEAEAKGLYRDCLENLVSTFDTRTIEDDFLSLAISQNNELRIRTEGLIQKNWEEQNSDIREDAQRQLNDLYLRIESTKNNLETANNELSKVVSKKETITKEIENLKQVSLDIEIAVEERMKDLRSNVVDFIADLLVKNHIPLPVTNDSKKSEQTGSKDINDNNYILKEIKYNSHEKVECHNWSEMIDTMHYELESAGVSTKLSIGLATFLSSSFLAKQPIMLIGPNSDEIVQAFAASLGVSTIGDLFCDGKFKRNIVSEIGKCEEKIVVIHGLFDSNWINRIPEIISEKNVFYIAVHPYAEDILVESKTVYSFLLPLFTELFVDHASDRKFIGGYSSEDFLNYSPMKDTIKRLPLGLNLISNRLIKDKIRTITKIMKEINSEIDESETFLYCIIPYIFGTGQVNKLVEFASNYEAKLSDEVKSIIKRMDTDLYG